MTADIQGESITVTGQGCNRGKKHATAEILHPVRSLTSIVRVRNREDTMVSVKTADPVPKEALFAIMEQIHATMVDAPIQIGDCIIDDIYDTKIIATKQIL
jgi:CxxC motif-containing protein